jgi:hypothetical protein
MPTVVTFDFGLNNIANVRIRRGVFDSAQTLTMEVIASSHDNPATPNINEDVETDLSQMSIRETRMGADTGTGSGIKVSLANSKAFIKTLEIADNYIVSKASTDGSFIELDPASAGIIRAANITGNTLSDEALPEPPVEPIQNASITGNMLGAALPTPNQNPPPPMTAAIRLGMGNVLVANNTLQSAKEGAPVQDLRVDHFVKVTRDIANVVLLGNAAMGPITGFLLEGDDGDPLQPDGVITAGRHIATNLPGDSRTVLTLRQEVATADVGAGATLPGLSMRLQPDTAYKVTGTFSWTSSSTATGAGFAFDLSDPSEHFVSTCAVNTQQTGSSVPTFFPRRRRGELGVTSGVDVLRGPMFATCTASFLTGAVAPTLSTRAQPSTANIITVQHGSIVEVVANR